MKHVLPKAPRNPFAGLARQRRAGRHRAGTRQNRQRELAALAEEVKNKQEQVPD